MNSYITKRITCAAIHYLCPQNQQVMGFAASQGTENLQSIEVWKPKTCNLSKFRSQKPAIYRSLEAKNLQSIEV